MDFMRRGVILWLTVAFVAGCGGGSKSTGPSLNPTISNLLVLALTAEIPGRRVSYELQFDVFDAQGDVFGGSCEIATSRGALSSPIAILLPGTDPNATSARVFCRFSVGIPATGNVSVIDRGGNRSNSLFFTLGTGERQRGASEVISGDAQGGDAGLR